jgi:hypothetical protein
LSFIHSIDLVLKPSTDLASEQLASSSKFRMILPAANSDGTRAVHLDRLNTLLEQLPAIHSAVGTP